MAKMSRQKAGGRGRKRADKFLKEEVGSLVVDNGVPDLHEAAEVIPFNDAITPAMCVSAWPPRGCRWVTGPRQFATSSDPEGNPRPS